MSMTKRAIIKNAFGICSYKGCLKKATKQLNVYMFGYSSKLCQKHYNELALKDEPRIMSKER